MKPLFWRGTLLLLVEGGSGQGNSRTNLASADLPSLLPGGSGDIGGRFLLAASPLFHRYLCNA